MSRYAAPPDTRLYAIGDIHGEAALLELLLERIEADAAAHPATRHVLIYLGDYVDRGPASCEVLDRLVAGPPQGFEQVCLRGNHEEMMLGFLTGNPALGGLWLDYGGDETCRSYGVDPEERPAALAEALRARLPESHRALLWRLALSHREDGYFFAHAGVRPGVPLARQQRDDLIWIRGLFHRSDADHGGVVVHGHSPVAAPENHHNRINVDTGAVYGNALTAVVLAGQERAFLQVDARSGAFCEIPSAKESGSSTA
ncbi:metallophosphoesterase family protein [Aquibaculum arenosum]|uniref:Metallophosphoesterase family protein n=1 Tax=Aquibaculum arenosum TaxID=3032591 RepID=A0ABT5YKV3_9PROT|nr:metallophosphoesterase family protein [Fodinicurvata sp. CAU 1616]MDF2095502.1 metallophosphoesterase family protein [Fodinicurvata sp. CAU 1616]